jgi:hypothetical protein
MTEKKTPELGAQKPCKECPLQQEKVCRIEKANIKIKDLVETTRIRTDQTTTDELDKALAPDINSGVYFEDEDKEFPLLVKQKDGTFLYIENEEGQVVPVECPLIYNNPSAYQKMMKIIGQVRRYTLKHIPPIPKVSMLKMPTVKKRTKKK